MEQARCVVSQSSFSLCCACRVDVFSCALMHVVCLLSLLPSLVFLCSDCVHWLLVHHGPKRDLSAKDAPSKKKERKSIMLEQKMDSLRRYSMMRGESTAVIRNTLNLPTLRTIRKDREITAAVKAGAGSCSMKVSSGQSNIMVRMEMLVTWMEYSKHQGRNMTFDDTKNKAMECFSYLKEKRQAPCLISLPALAGFISLRCTMASIASSAQERPKAQTTTPLLPTQIISRPSSRRGVQAPAGF